MLVAQLLGVLERLAPAELAEDWDNVGLLVGRHNQPVTRLLVALELRDEVVGEAQEHGCDAVLTHHPPIFPALSRVTDDAAPGELVLRAAEARIAVVAAHTNLDAATGGLNDQMAELLGLTAAAPLAPAPADPAVGLGRLGLVTPTTLERLVRRVRDAFATTRLTYAGDPGARVERVACCTGAGGSLIDAARAAGADVYVTSDLRYHDADRAAGMPLVSLPHAQVERRAMERWTRRLSRALDDEGVEVRFAVWDTDPWQPA
jgi:dinuclear metal center YbgI/SA1388 family protein